MLDLDITTDSDLPLEIVKATYDLIDHGIHILFIVDGGAEVSLQINGPHTKATAYPPDNGYGCGISGDYGDQPARTHRDPDGTVVVHVPKMDSHPSYVAKVRLVEKGVE